VEVVCVALAVLVQGAVIAYAHGNQIAACIHIHEATAIPVLADDCPINLTIGVDSPRSIDQVERSAAVPCPPGWGRRRRISRTYGKAEDGGIVSGRPIVIRKPVLDIGACADVADHLDIAPPLSW